MYCTSAVEESGVRSAFIAVDDNVTQNYIKQLYVRCFIFVFFCRGARKNKFYTVVFVVSFCETKFIVELKKIIDSTYSVAFHAPLGVLFFIALDADHFLVTRYETLVANRLHANLAAETLFVPLLSFVLVLFHPCTMPSVVQNGINSNAYQYNLILLQRRTVNRLKFSYAAKCTC